MKKHGRDHISGFHDPLLIFGKKLLERVVVIGAGSHAQVVADILLCMRNRGSPVEPIGFVDDDPHLAGKSRLGLPILGPIKSLADIPHDAVVIGIGDNATRAAIFERLRAAGGRFYNPIHPSAIVSPTARIGAGSVICAGVIIGVLVSIGDNVIVNTRATLEHHSTLGDHAHLGGGALGGGELAIGPGAFIGMGATIVSGCRIGAWSFIGAATLVFRDVPERGKLLAVNKQFKRYPAGTAA